MGGLRGHIEHKELRKDTGMTISEPFPGTTVYGVQMVHLTLKMLDSFPSGD